jgi:exosortase E/protease (VPEID-CTERM system)
VRRVQTARMRPALTIQHPARSLWPIALLLCEYLGISLHFDALPLLQGAGLTKELGHIGIVAPLFIVVATATYMLSGRALRSELSALLSAAPVFARRHAVGLCVNLTSYAGLWLLTGELLSRVESGAPIAPSWLGLWLLLTAACAASSLWIVLPRGLPNAVVKRGARAIGFGLGAGVLAWGAGVASGLLWSKLQTLTLYTVYSFLQPMAAELVFEPDGAIIGTPDFVVQVAPECSGIEGIGLIIVVMSGFLISARERLRFPRALVILPLAVGAVWLGNALRIALLIEVGARWSPEIALSGFHSKAGWLFFCGIALGFFAWAQRSRWLQQAELSPQPSAADVWSPTATYLAPLLALIAASLATALFSTGFDRLYGLRIAAVLIALYAQRRHLPAPRWQPSWHAPAIGLLVFALWLVLVPQPPAAEAARLQAEVGALGRGWGALWLVLRALGSIVTVPIAEELAFRGFLLRRLIARDFSEVDWRRSTPLALLGSSLAFGLLHSHAWAAASLAGVAYGLAQQARGRIGDAIIAHALTNALIAADVLFFQAWWLWV